MSISTATTTGQTTTTGSPSPSPAAPLVAMDPQRLRRVKKSYTTRYVAAALDADPSGYSLLAGPGVRPRAGDVVVARVVEIGKHTRLEGADSRRQLMFPGQEILLAYGDRYAPDQFLAEVPRDLGPCHLVAAGGVAGTVVDQHAAIDDATLIEPLGLLSDADGVVTLADHAPHRVSHRSSDQASHQSSDQAPGSRPADGPLVLAVLGTSMNSGKSTTLACLVNGLSNAGLVVSAGKATGTGAGGDPHLFRDAGAARVLDFTDFGLPSTFRLDVATVRDLWGAVVDTLAEDGPDVVVVEVADGLYQGETSQLLGDAAFTSRVDGVLFAAQDALGAAAGVEHLHRLGLPVVAASGVLTASPLAGAEAREALAVQVVDTYDLCDPEVATRLLEGLREHS